MTGSAHRRFSAVKPRTFFAAFLAVSGVTSASAQVSSSVSANQGGLGASKEGHYVEAETFFRVAFRHAAAFGEFEPSFASALNNLATAIEA
jgi:hypothetical protein